MKNKKFIGVYRLRNCPPGFGFPVYRVKDGVVAFSTVKNEKIKEFLYIDITDSIILPATNEPKVPKVGDPCLYAFHFLNGDLIVGTRRELSSRLKKELPILKKNHPYVAEDVEGFLNNEK